MGRLFEEIKSLFYEWEDDSYNDFYKEAKTTTAKVKNEVRKNFESKTQELFEKEIELIDKEIRNHFENGRDNCLYSIEHNLLNDYIISEKNHDWNVVKNHTNRIKNHYKAQGFNVSDFGCNYSHKFHEGVHVYDGETNLFIEWK